MLRTIAVGGETPELLPAAIPEPPAGANAQSIVNSVANTLGLTPPTVNLGNDVQIIREIRREFQVTRNGQRDALWALRRAIGEARRLVVVASPQFCVTARPGTGGAAAHELDLVAVLADRLTAQPLAPSGDRHAAHARPCTGVRRLGARALAARATAVATLRSAASDRVVAFHPVGFPGRDVRIRTTSVIVDDEWAMVGTSHWRRRGMTFDEGVDLVALDRSLDTTGASARIRTYRRGLLAQLLQVPAPTPPTPPVADWVRLSSARSTHDLVNDLLSQGGLGRISPFWPGPAETDVLPQNSDIADPDVAQMRRDIQDLILRFQVSETLRHGHRRCIPTVLRDLLEALAPSGTRPERAAALQSLRP